MRAILYPQTNIAESCCKTESKNLYKSILLISGVVRTQKFVILSTEESVALMEESRRRVERP
jgi:hypothetical protein